MPTDNQWAQAFTGRRRGLHAETAQSALTVLLKWVTLWSDQLHFDCFTVQSSVQGCFVPIYLRLVLRIVAACVMATHSGHHVFNFSHLVGISVSTGQLKG